MSRVAVLWLTAVAVALAVVVPGCGGCSQSASTTQEEDEKTAEEKKKEEERKKEEAKKKPLQARGLATRPAAMPRLGALPPPSRRGVKANDRLCKPGHWTAVTLVEAKANHDDFRGQLEVWVTDGKMTPAALENQPYEVSVSRGVTLPKGQPRQFESAFFVPPGTPRPSTWFRVAPLGGSRGDLESSIGLTVMPSYQYHLVVLARLPAAYNYLESLRSVRGNDGNGASFKPFYMLHLLNVANARERLFLPTQSMFWTSTAYVLWDDADPAWLDFEQKQAMLDWLHWGGQLIVSGPTTLDGLRDSFLAPYLPAEAAANVTLTQDDLDPLQYWNGSDPGWRPLKMARPWGGVKLKLNPAVDARFVPHCGELVAEGRVGRGRIVVSAIRLRGNDLVAWPGYDMFFNACLLGRPSRDYQLDLQDSIARVKWNTLVDVWRRDASSNTPRYVREPPHPLDAGLSTTVRYFSRDTGRTLESYAADRATSDTDTGADPVYSSGMAAWTDNNLVADQARQILQNASRVEIPRGSFVLWVIGAYLIVLVPLNWLVFRMIGRVEWAWAAAPLIAIVCTVVVIRAAQLDIGFVRARTEVGILELQGQHTRAHLTRYASLYTSLTTAYRFEIEDAGGVVQPFSPLAEGGERPRFGASNTKLRVERGETVQMSGLSVDSSSLKYLHGEQMLDLPGPLALVQNVDGGLEVVNRTGLRLSGAAIVRRKEKGIEYQWLGDLEPETTKPVIWEWDSPPSNPANRAEKEDPSAAAARVSLFAAHRNDTPLTTAGVGGGELSIRGLTDIAEDHAHLAVGETRLVAWIDEELPGLDVRPAAPQSRHATLVVAHLGYGFERDAEPDVRLDPERTKTKPKDDETAGSP